LEDITKYGRTIMKWVLNKKYIRERPGFIWLRCGSLIDYCIYGNEPSGSVKETGISRETEKILTSAKGFASWNLLISWNKLANK
jgi:hypothetical protein